MLCDLPAQEHTRQIGLNYGSFDAVWSWDSKSVAVYSNTTIGTGVPFLYNIRGGPNDGWSVEQIDLASSAILSLPKTPHVREWTRYFIHPVQWSADNSQILMTYFARVEMDFRPDIPQDERSVEGCIVYDLHTGHFTQGSGIFILLFRGPRPRRARWRSG